MSDRRPDRTSNRMTEYMRHFKCKNKCFRAGVTASKICLQLNEKMPTGKPIVAGPGSGNSTC